MSTKLEDKIEMKDVYISFLETEIQLLKELDFEPCDLCSGVYESNDGYSYNGEPTILYYDEKYYLYDVITTCHWDNYSNGFEEETVQIEIKHCPNCGRNLSKNIVDLYKK